MGPLLALDAVVKVYTSDFVEVPVSDYVSGGEYRKNLVTSVHIEDLEWQYAYHRHVRTETDYPAFTVTVLRKNTGPGELRIIIWGCKGRYARLEELEDRILNGTHPSELGAASIAVPDFADRLHGGASYLRRCAQTAVKRGLLEVVPGE
jgi:CO/xanthine dehydrogenase FAD-binding subunit